jgi:hypothetical protein
MGLEPSGTTTAEPRLSLGLQSTRGRSFTRRSVSARKRAAAGSHPVVTNPGRRGSSRNTSRRRRPLQLRPARAQAQHPGVHPGQAALKKTSDPPRPHGIAQRPTTKTRSRKPDKDDSQLRRFHPSGTSRSSGRQVPQPPLPQLMLRPVRHLPATLETVPATPLAPKLPANITSS